MRFRAKFGALGWCWVSIACFVLVLWFSGLHSRKIDFLAVIFVILASLRVLNQILIYWDLNSDSLREHRLWNKKEVAWVEVTHVGSWHPKQPSSDYLAIDYFSSAPLSHQGRIVACPEDRAGFLAALRKFAPQAVFDV
jgi:hypothetical protein